MENKIIVNSLSEYISAIEKYGLYNCISRGENQAYEFPLRSGIHRSQFNDYENILDEYYLEVEPDLSELQKKNYIAFAQHHGLPTNLLDFSSSPLISLYFCVDDCKEKGYVYFVSKSRTVQINKAIYGKPNGWGLLEDLMDYDSALMDCLLPGMKDAFYSNRLGFIDYFEKHTEDLIEKISRTRSSGPLGEINLAEQLEVALNKYKEDKVGWDLEYPDEPHTLQIRDSIPNFLKGFSSIYKDDIFRPTVFYRKFEDYYHKSGYINPAMMIMLLKHEMIEYIYYDFKLDKLEYEIEFPFYFTYKPPVIDDRVKNQQSIFIFQPFEILKHLHNGKDVHVWQKIKSDFVIEIRNPKEIKQELDAIGINLKTIYCDFDSKAKYIKETFK